MAQFPWMYQSKLGRGTSSDSGTFFGYGVDFDTPTQQGSGQTVISSLESVVSSSSLLDKLNVNASASYLAGVGGGSAEFNLSHSVQINDYYTYALVKVIVANAPFLMENPRFNAAALKLLNNKGSWDDFALTYGWEYIEGYVSGGSFFGLIEIQTQSSTEQLDVSGKLSGFYGSFSGAASVNDQISKTLSSYSIQTYTYQNGGSGDRTERTLEGMLDRAAGFPAEVTATAKSNNIYALTSNYRQTLALPPIPAPNSAILLNQKSVLQDLGRAYLEYRDYKANIEFVLGHLYDFDEYRNFTTAQYDAVSDQFKAELIKVSKELDNIVLASTNCGNDFGQCPNYSASITPLKLPSIGGQLMTLKQIEDSLTAVTSVANQALTQANGAMTQANGAMTQANGAMTQANGAMTQANGAVTQANAAMTQANAAYNLANK